MHYEINVSKWNPNSRRFEHYFATNKRSLMDRRTAGQVLKHFLTLFTEPDYNVSLSRCQETSESLDIEKFIIEAEKL